MLMQLFFMKQTWVLDVVCVMWFDMFCVCGMKSWSFRVGKKKNRLKGLKGEKLESVLMSERFYGRSVITGVVQIYFVAKYIVSGPNCAR